jgi:two-component system, LuxR family, response regulator FixJ
MTVALIDDDAAVLDSLRMALRKRGIEVACFASAEDFLAGFDALDARCVVTDVRMPGLSGIDLQHELIRRGSAVPLILITGHGDIAMAVDAIKLGAFDFIEKPFEDQRLAESIRKALAHADIERTRQGERAVIAARAAELSHRQRQVMALVAKGRSNKEIAIELAISPRTVENYRAWVMEKMGATNLAELVRMTVLLESADTGGVETAP